MLSFSRIASLKTAKTLNHVSHVKPTIGFGSSFVRWDSDKIAAIELRKGTTIKKNNKYFDVMKTEHVAPSQRAAIIQVEMVEIPKGVKVNTSFRSGEIVEVVATKMAYATFEEKDGKTLKFVDTDSEEEYEVPDSYANLTYLKEDMECAIRFVDDKPVQVKIPLKVDVLVKEIVMRGTCKIENGRSIRVPDYIKPGDTISVSTENDAYIGKVSSGEGAKPTYHKKDK